MVAKISGEDFFRLLDCVVTHEMIDEMLNEHEKEEKSSTVRCLLGIRMYIMLFPNFLTRP